MDNIRLKALYNENITHTLVINGIDDVVNSSSKYIGERIKITAGTKDRYIFDRFNISPSTLQSTSVIPGTIEFDMPDENVSISAIWNHKYIDITDNGSVSANATLKAAATNSVDLVIPSEINGIKVTSIASNGFEECMSLNSIEIPSTVTDIGSMAFYSCSFKQVTFHDNSTSDKLLDIGAVAFSYNPRLSSIIFPNSKVKIANNGFSNLDSLTSITIPYNVDPNMYIFEKCKSLISATVDANTGRSLGIFGYTGGNMLANCPSLRSVTFGHNIKMIPNEIFNKCSSLTSITIPANITQIADNAFSGSAINTININKPKDSIAGAPWGAPNATVKWLG